MRRNSESLYASLAWNCGTQSCYSALEVMQRSVLTPLSPPVSLLENCLYLLSSSDLKKFNPINIFKVKEGTMLSCTAFWPKRKGKLLVLSLDFCLFLSHSPPFGPSKCIKGSHWSLWSLFYIISELSLL